MKNVILLLILFMISACGAAPTQIDTTEVQPLTTPTSPASVVEETAAPVIATITVAPTAVPATPTETQLPPLELPTPMASAPTLLAWDGVPTYPGDSKPGYFFRVNYAPDIWALISDDYGFPAIAHRGIDYCVVSPVSGGGLPANMRMVHDVRRINGIAYEVSIAYTSAGVRQFASYVGGDANIYTGFQVNFQQDADLCLKEAEMVLATLTSVSEAQATPAAPAP